MVVEVAPGAGQGEGRKETKLEARPKSSKGLEG